MADAGDIEWWINQYPVISYIPKRDTSDFMKNCNHLLCRAGMDLLSLIQDYNYYKKYWGEKETCRHFGNGGDINSEEDKGRVLHENGMTFNWEEEHPITKEMEDYIKWDCLWNTAESNGWVSFSHKGNDYLVHR